MVNDGKTHHIKNLQMYHDQHYLLAYYSAFADHINTRTYYIPITTQLHRNVNKFIIQYTLV